jgi:DNA helicase II / ATP-dependent DNA helicase PcrA
MLVDEYQDTNKIQYLLTKLLASGSNNVTVVGDADQAIYSWRGADFRNILNFERDWPNAKVITLEQNYRSTKLILEAANEVIQRNIERKEKNLWTENGRGDPIEICIAENERGEAMLVANQMLYLREQGTSLRDMAILYRTNAQSRAMEEALIVGNIPYKLIGGVRFYERKEIKDILAYLRLAANKKDTISLKRIINVPTRGIGKRAQGKYLTTPSGLTTKEQTTINHFEKIIHTLQQAIANLTATDVVRMAITVSGYEAFVRDSTQEGEDRWANIQELFTVTQKYDALPPPESTERFLEEVALLSDADGVDQSQSAVHLMTIHAAKGLEFDVVFIIGLEEGIFPHSMSSLENKELEEERRLCYVALTRAKVKLFLSLARTRLLYGEKMWNEPSRFLRDIPEHLFSNAPDLDGSKHSYIDFEE